MYSLFIRDARFAFPSLFVTLHIRCELFSAEVWNPIVCDKLIFQSITIHLSKRYLKKKVVNMYNPYTQWNLFQIILFYGEVKETVMIIFTYIIADAY